MSPSGVNLQGVVLGINKYTAKSNTYSFKASCSHILMGMEIIQGANVHILCPCTPILIHVFGGPMHWLMEGLGSRLRPVF